MNEINTKEENEKKIVLREKEIIDLKQEIKDLKKDIIDLKDKKQDISDLKKDIIDLKEKNIISLKEEIIILRKEIVDLKKEIVEKQKAIEDSLKKEMEVAKNINKEQFRIIIEGMNRLESRLDSHVENQATMPIQQLESLKKMINDYFVVYKEETDKKIMHNERVVRKTNKEVFGNGKKGLVTDMGVVKARLNMVVWLVGILLTGGGLSIFGFILWEIVKGGVF